jgi:hypothetical protein
MKYIELGVGYLILCEMTWSGVEGHAKKADACSYGTKASKKLHNTRLTHARFEVHGNLQSFAVLGKGQREFLHAAPYEFLCWKSSTSDGL